MSSSSCTVYLAWMWRKPLPTGVDKWPNMANISMLRESRAHSQRHVMLVRTCTYTYYYMYICIHALYRPTYINVQHNEEDLRVEVNLQRYLLLTGVFASICWAQYHLQTSTRLCVLCTPFSSFRSRSVAPDELQFGGYRQQHSIYCSRISLCICVVSLDT